MAAEIDAVLAENEALLSELAADPRLQIPDPEQAAGHAGEAEDEHGDDADGDHAHADTPAAQRALQARYERIIKRSNRRCERILTEVAREHPELLAIGRATVDGGGVAECLSAGAHGPREVGDRIFFQRAYQRNRMAVGDYEFDPEKTSRYLGIGQPMPAAIVFARLNLDELTRRISTVERSEGIDFVVTDENGTIIARPSISYFTGRSLAGMDELVDAMLERDSGTASIEVEDRERLYAFAVPERAEGSLRVAVGIPG